MLVRIDKLVPQTLIGQLALPVPVVRASDEEPPIPPLSTPLFQVLCTKERMYDNDVESRVHAEPDAVIQSQPPYIRLGINDFVRSSDLSQIPSRLVWKLWQRAPHDGLETLFSIYVEPALEEDQKPVGTRNGDTDGLRILVSLAICPRNAFIWDLDLLLLSCCSGVSYQ